MSRGSAGAPALRATSLEEEANITDSMRWMALRLSGLLGFNFLNSLKECSATVVIFIK